MTNDERQIFIKGTETIGEAAIRAGCRFFYAYPITPVTELIEYMARNLSRVGGTFLQAESEIAAINMAYGTSAAGFRVMTATSGPGMSLMQEGLSYLAGAELPCVIVNLSRSGPGLGNIFPSQSDYFQATRPGHGDYRLIVLAPSSVQEAADLTFLAFHLSDKYRNPAVILSDGVLGQMVERVTFSKQQTANSEQQITNKDWATTGAKGRERNVITSVHIQIKDMSAHIMKLKEKYEELARDHTRYESYRMDDAEVALIAFGTVARIATKAIDNLRAVGKKVGLIRPITLFPFPYDAIREAASQVKEFMVVEMNLGQMIDDVKLAVMDKRPVHFKGFPGGQLPKPEEIERMLGELGGTL